MKALIARTVFAGIFALTGCATQYASISSGHSRQTTDASNSQLAGQGETLLDRAIYQQSLRALGVDPKSHQAAILRAWKKRLGDDPELKAAFPLGLPTAPTPAGKLLFAEGMARVTPATRAAFWSLYTKVTLAHLPDDCYGIRNRAEIAHRVMSFPNMSDSDTEEYMRILWAVLHAGVRHDPEHVPTEAEHQAAVVALSKVLSADMLTATNANRFARVMVSPATASIKDFCWAMKTSTEALNQLDPADKEALLSQSLDQAALNALRTVQPTIAPPPTPSTAPSAFKTL
jgi:hypothetical protein